ncbi:MAG TPA: MFS transporter [Solirubrobacteraceae bacterium]|jgi:MFS family permease|nr:MFS transporter [Solirubrobacteraceae bacterium]
MLARSLGLDELPRRMRPLAAGGSLSAVGSGLWFTIWALYLIQRVGLSGAQTGAALSMAGAVGFFSPAPLGRLADRRGPREVYAVLLAAEGVAVLGFLLCRSFAAVVVVAAATAACDQGKTGVRAALISQLAPEDGRVGALACLRSCAHTGTAVGAGLGALVIAAGSGPAYGAAIVFNGASYLAYAVALRWVPHVPPCPSPRNAVRLSAFRDLPYTSLAAICGVLTLCWGLLSAGLPLWIVTRTRAPHALAGVVILISSITIATMQVRFSRATDTPRTASAAALRSGLSLAACCVLFAISAGPGALAATALILAGAGAHVLGELWFVAGAWGLSVPLMPPDRPAEYQGVFATGEALAIMLSPALMTGAVVPAGLTGWLLLGLGFTAAGAAATPAARWAVRSRST